MSAEPTEPETGLVYFLVMHDAGRPDFDFGLVKVGITFGDVAARVASLQTGNPYDLRSIASIETPWAVEVEHLMHRTHARDMFRNEWMRCRRDSLSILVGEAQATASRIAFRNSKALHYSQMASNGQVRPATAEDRRLHRDAQELIARLVPSRLRLETTGNRLKAATGTTCGIVGIIRVILVPVQPRFSAALAESRFPSLTSQCMVEKIVGAFRWTGVARRSDLKAESTLAREALKDATRAAKDLAASKISRLDGWMERSSIFEQWHEDFLQATQAVKRLEGELTDIQSEMTIRLEGCQAIEGVCHFKRESIPKFDGRSFRQRFPRESAQCLEEPCAGSGIRKSIYPARSYLGAPEERVWQAIA